MATNMSKKNIIIISAIAVSVIVIAILAFQFVRMKQERDKQQEDLQAASKLINYEKQQTEKEMMALSTEVDGYRGIGNDSIVRLIDVQKQKIKMLLQELHTTKSTDAKKIEDLRQELSVVRKVLVSYIRQVDSLNHVNGQLRTENTQVRQQYTEATANIDKLTKDKAVLSETVSRAAMLEASNINVTLLNKRNKATKKISKIKNISISFGIDKNITAKPGMKDVYIRIMNPNREIMTKSSSATFSFEGSNIPYSIKKQIEYKGERISDSMYWQVGETLIPGTYQVDIFADGRMIGRSSFTLQK